MEPGKLTTLVNFRSFLTMKSITKSLFHYSTLKRKNEKTRQSNEKERRYVNIVQTVVQA